MDNFVVSESKEFFSIFKRIKNRDFRGNSGAAIKNSIYQFSSTFAAKIGSLLFVVILARILMPELFGLYSLALGTILVFSYFADLGISQTLTRFVSREISKSKDSKAKAYTFYLFKIKLLITLGILLIFLLLSKTFSLYYQKPIFLVLLSGSLYLVSISLAGFLQGFFQSLNDFKTPFMREIIFQLLRIVLIPLFALYFVSKGVSGEKTLIFIFIFFGFLWMAMSLFLFLVAKKTSIFLSKDSKLSTKEKKEVNSFFKSLLVFSIFSVIFTYADIFILGGFVSSEYIGYYQAAMGLVGSLSALILFSNSLLPVFSRLKGNTLEIGFKKALRLTLVISCTLFVISFLSSEIIVNLLYGKVYAPAIPFFRGLCFLLILWPLTFLYNGYFIAKGKPRVIRNLLVFTASFNLILCLLLVYFFSKQRNSLAVGGLIFGTILSNILYLIGCVWKKRE
jgi:O-antigen/teichoic acid export membrane protein